MTVKTQKAGVENFHQWWGKS